MKEKEIKELKKKGNDLNDLGVDKSNTQPEEKSPTRDKSLFPPISELIQKIPLVKDKPLLPDIENKSIKEEKLREVLLSEMKIFVPMFLKGNLFFSKQQYEQAAQQYEKTGEWALQNSLRKEDIFLAYYSAMMSWISVNRMDKVFRILEKENLEGKYEMLKRSYTKIEAMVRHLVRNDEMRQNSGYKLLEMIRQKLIEIKPKGIQKQLFRNHLKERGFRFHQ